MPHSCWGLKRLRLTVDSGEQENLQIHHVVDDDGEVALGVAVTRPAPTGWPHPTGSSVHHAVGKGGTVCSPCIAVFARIPALGASDVVVEALLSMRSAKQVHRLSYN